MTTPASQELFALSRRVAAPYTDLPAARAAMVTGSVAKGISDYFSDVDMSIFYEDWLPDEETLTAIRSELGGSERKWMSGSREEGGFAEAFDLDGVEVQVIHTTLATWEATMAELQVNLKVDTPLAKALEGILICRPLYGDEIIERWRAQAADFPDALAEAMVKHYMKFFPAWGLAGYLDGRRHGVVISDSGGSGAEPGWHRLRAQSGLLHAVPIQAHGSLHAAVCDCACRFRAACRVALPFPT
ncbi:MAG: hypothetical protein R2856_31070 [Caldilineaceae bacterium]